MRKMFYAILFILLLATACTDAGVEGFNGYTDLTVDTVDYHWEGSSVGFHYSYDYPPTWTAIFADDMDNLYAYRNQIRLTLVYYDDIVPGTYSGSNTRFRYWNNSGTEFDTDDSGDVAITIDTWSGRRTTGSYSGTVEGLSVSGTFSSSYTE